MLRDLLAICGTIDRSGAVSRRVGFGGLRCKPSDQLVVVNEHPTAPSACAKPAAPALVIKTRGRSPDQRGRAGNAVIARRQPAGAALLELWTGVLRRHVGVVQREMVHSASAFTAIGEIPDAMFRRRACPICRASQ